MNKVQEKRLLNVARALEDAADSEKYFDMGMFFTRPQADGENWCATPACAFGHYVSRTDLQRTFEPRTKKGFYGLMKTESFYRKKRSRVYMNDPKFLKHFGIDDEECDELFAPDGCGRATTALDAAKYVKDFVKQKRRVNR